MTCTFEVSETCLPDEWIGVNKKKTTNICTDSQGTAASSENCEHVAPPPHKRFDFG